MPPSALDRWVDGLVCADLPFDILVCRPAVTDDCSAGLDLVTKGSHQGIRRFFPERELGIFSGLALHTTKHPLLFRFVTPILLSPTGLALVNFDGLVRTADFLRAA